MNFTYDGADLTTTIKKYTRNENYFKIEFLDGSTREYISQDNNEEEKILNIMTNQAQDRQDKTKDANNSILVSSTFSTKRIKAKYELKKYKMFLELAKKTAYEELDQNWSSFIGKDKIYEAPFNINTLDSKSYSIVKSFYKKYNSKK